MKAYVIVTAVADGQSIHINDIEQIKCNSIGTRVIEASIASEVGHILMKTIEISLISALHGRLARTFLRSLSLTSFSSADIRTTERVLGMKIGAMDQSLQLKNVYSFLASKELCRRRVQPEVRTA